MVHLQPKHFGNTLRSGDSDVILVSCEFFHNVLLCHVRVEVTSKNKTQGVIKKISSKDKRQAFFLANTGFELIQLIVNFISSI